METKGPANNGARRRKNIVLEGCWTGVGRKVLRMLRGEKQQQQVYRKIEIVREEGELVNRHFFSDIFLRYFLGKKKKKTFLDILEGYKAPNLICADHLPRPLQNVPTTTRIGFFFLGGERQSLQSADYVWLALWTFNVRFGDFFDKDGTVVNAKKKETGQKNIRRNSRWAKLSRRLVPKRFKGITKKSWTIPSHGIQRGSRNPCKTTIFLSYTRPVPDVFLHCCVGTSCSHVLETRAIFVFLQTFITAIFDSILWVYHKIPAVGSLFENGRSSS